MRINEFGGRLTRTLTHLYPPTHPFSHSGRLSGAVFDLVAGRPAPGRTSLMRFVSSANFDLACLVSACGSRRRTPVVCSRSLFNSTTLFRFCGRSISPRVLGTSLTCFILARDESRLRGAALVSMKRRARPTDFDLRLLAVYSVFRLALCVY